MRQWVQAWIRRHFGSAPAEADAGLRAAREEAVRARLRERCASFRRLLSANKSALEAMSDAEERLAHAKPFGMTQIAAVSGQALTAVGHMVEELNALSGNAHAPLQETFTRIRSAMDALLGDTSWDCCAALNSAEPLILPLEQIRLDDLPRVGGKTANLGETAAGVGLAVPDGFAVTVAAYCRFMQYNGLRREIARRLAAADLHSLDGLFSLSASLQQCILAAPLPPELEDALQQAVQSLCRRAGPDLLLAVRSSAVGEDALNATFAGQYRSELNVPPEEVCDVWKEIVAGKYSVTAMSYRFQRGIPDEAAPMSVGVLAMVRARAGGVAYSRDPAAPKQSRMLLNAVPGLPSAVVDGSVIPDVFVFSRENRPRLLEKHLAAGSGLSDAQAVQLARITMALEGYYNEPQDVEWALDEGESCTITGGIAAASAGADRHELAVSDTPSLGTTSLGTASSERRRIVILQSRPLRDAGRDVNSTAAAAGITAVPAQTAGLDAGQGDASHILAHGGVTVSPGVAMGPLFIARKEADMLSFPQGGILVVEHAYPRWATLLPRAAGLVSATGGTAGHLASVAREYNVPAVFSLPNACALAAPSGEVTLDAGRCLVLAGRHPELSAADSREEAAQNLMRGSPIYKRLEDLARLMTPLHLLDPDAANFTPQSCLSLHDITRFCHEKAVRLMFDDTTGISAGMGKQLKVGVALQYWVVDTGEGFRRPVSKPVVELQDIACTPMLALWDGMVAVPWAGPPAAGAAGFMSVVFESAMNPDLESTAPPVMAEKNFFIIGAEYMILQARYGYHFCTVECLAANTAHENFVSFQFKGGAADRERRAVRTRMLADLLEAHGFRTDAKGDCLFAAAEGFDAAETLKRVRLLGYLLIHSRQTDMIMLESARAAQLRDKWTRDAAMLAQRLATY